FRQVPHVLWGPVGGQPHTSVAPNWRCPGRTSPADPEGRAVVEGTAFGRSVQPTRRGSLHTAVAVAESLREEILTTLEEGPEREEDGSWFLGYEEELAKRMGTSKPTLRQAGRLLEAEQLIVVRRGVTGGWFGRPPTSDGVTHAASILLRSQGA